MKTQPGTRQATGPITSSSDLAYNPMGFQALEERQLLAADLYITGLIKDDNPTDINIGEEIRSVVKDSNGNDIQIMPGSRVNLSFLLNNSGDSTVQDPEVGVIWDNDDDLTNGFLRVLDIWDVADEIGGTNDPANPVELTVNREIIIPPDAEFVELAFDSDGELDRENFTNVPYLHIVADPRNLVGESDESNNITDNTGSINPFNSPTRFLGFHPRFANVQSDLIGTQLDIASDFNEAWAGGDIDLTYSIRNVGWIYSNGFTVRFYLSAINNADNAGTLNGENYETINPDEDVLLGQQNWISGLARGEESTRTVTLTLPDPDDDWWDEANNDTGQNFKYYIGFVIVQGDEFPDETIRLSGDGATINNSNNGFYSQYYNDAEDPSVGDAAFDLVFNTDVNDDLTDDFIDRRDTEEDIDLNGFYTLNDNNQIYNFDTLELFIWQRAELVTDPQFLFTRRVVQLADEFPDDTITETVDNIGLISVDPDDLDAGGSYQAQLTIYNYSKIETTEDFDLQFYISSDRGIELDQDYLIGEITIRANEIGHADYTTGDAASKTFTVTITLPNINDDFWVEGQDEYFIGSTFNSPTQLDPPDGFVQEEDIFNDNSNVGVGYDVLGVTVTNAGSSSSTTTGKDLSPLAFNVLPTIITPDKTFYLKFKYQNEGTSWAGQSVAYFYASTDSTIDPDEDTLIAIKNIKGISAGAGSRVVAVKVDEISSGSEVFANGNNGFVYIGVVLDAENDINEGDESNNTGTVANGGAELVRIRSANQIFDLAPNKIDQARFIGTPSENRYDFFSDFVGASDKYDWYRMTITETSLLRLLLKDTTGDADIFLKGPGGNLLTFKKNEGTRNEYIKWVVNPGTYWVQVRPGDPGDNAQYTFGAWAQPTGLTTAANRTGDFTFTVSSNSLSDLTT